jgi:hypothetical protein
MLFLYVAVTATLQLVLVLVIHFYGAPVLTLVAKTILDRAIRQNVTTSSHIYNTSSPKHGMWTICLTTTGIPIKYGEPESSAKLEGLPD